MRTDFLAARERRQELVAAAIAARGGATTAFLSLNIPGAEKTPPGAEAFFAAMRDRTLAALAPCAIVEEGRDALGPYAIFSLAIAAVEAKRTCVALEASEPGARLADLDVYASDGRQVDRASRGLAGRSCLVCTQAAVDCIRAGRHQPHEVINRVHELLANYRA